MLLTKDFKLISQWAYKWKMLFNPYPRKLAVEVCFSHKRNNVSLTFNNNKIQSAPSQKHLGLVLDSMLDFNQQIDDKINRCNKIIGVMKRLSMTCSRKTLLIIYKSFVGPLLDYTDIICDKPNNESFKRKLEAVQYNASLVITGMIIRTSRERLYYEPCLESLRWSRKLFFFHKTVKGFSHLYLQEILSPCNEPCYQNRTKSAKNIQTI